MATPDETPNPAQPSSSHAAMVPTWTMVRDLLAGNEAVRAKREAYLPRFPDEEAAEYGVRLETSFLANFFEDTLRHIVSQPFSEEVRLQDGAPAELAAWAADLDLEGNNLHVVARRWFEDAVPMGFSFALVDYPRIPPGLTLAEERALGARPYVRIIPADRMIAVYATVVAGRLVIDHARFREDVIERDGFKERKIERIRLFERRADGVWFEVWRKGEDGWSRIEEGRIALDVVPVVPLFTAEHAADFVVKPPLKDLAYKQIQHYQTDSALRSVLDNTCFPMLVAIGVRAPVDEQNKPVKITIGPKRSLFVPQPPGESGKAEVKFCEPQASSIAQLRERLKDLQDEMRLLGMQPLLPAKGSFQASATGTAINARKAHSAVQAWALGLKDAIEQVLRLMARWRGLAETAQVHVNTDFEVTLRGDEDIKELREMRAMRLISQRTYWAELARRSFLGPQFDPEREEALLEEEGPLGTGRDGHGHEDGPNPTDAAGRTGSG